MTEKARPSAAQQFRVQFSVLVVITLVLVYTLLLHNQYLYNTYISSKRKSGLLVDNMNTPRNRYNRILASTGSTYPVCQKSTLRALGEAVGLEEALPHAVDKQYNQYVADRQVHCGKERAGMGLFERKKYALRTDCSGIVSAKRRLLEHVKSLCAAQERAAAASSPDYAAAAKIDNSTVADLSRHSLLSKYNGGSGAPKRSRGIIYTGTPEHLKSIFQSIWAHRVLKSDLPVEVWMNERDEFLCRNLLEKALPGVSCRLLSNSVSGFASKFYALLSTTFTDVVFMDADNIPVRNVNEIFDSRAYTAFGAVLWPDISGNACQSSKEAAPLSPRGATQPPLSPSSSSSSSKNITLFETESNGYSSYSSHVLWKSHFAGLQWRDERRYAQDSEAGQLAIDTSRHGGLLELGRLFIEDRAFLRGLVDGDKDVFRIVFLIAGEQFHFVPHLPALSYTNTGLRDSIVQFFETADGEVLPLFVHQNKQRDLTGYSLQHAWAVPRQQSNLSSVCVLLSEQSVAFVNKAGLRERVPLEEVRLPEMAAYYRSLADVKNVHMTGEYNVASLSDFGKVLFNWVDNNWPEAEGPFRLRLAWNRLRSQIIYYKRKLGLLQ